MINPPKKDNVLPERQVSASVPGLGRSASVCAHGITILEKALADYNYDNFT